MLKAMSVFGRALKLIDVPAKMTGSEWADEHFYLSQESSNSSGKWKTTAVQRAVLNSFCNDAIEKVDLFKSARVGGSKMMIAALGYYTSHKRRKCGFWHPTDADSKKFVKVEVEPAIRDCAPWREARIGNGGLSSEDTLSHKKFLGCVALFKGGNSPNAYRQDTLDVSLLDELDGFPKSIGNEGSATALSWGRIKNSHFKKQIQVSTPTLSGFSQIETSAKDAEDLMEFYAECPECKGHAPLEWGGPDVEHGIKWDGTDPYSVKYYCKLCGVGWQNSNLGPACEAGYWQGPRGFRTSDGVEWFKDNLPVSPPRHIAFSFWTVYSLFSPWSQMVQEWYDAQGDIGKIQAFTNTTLGKVWHLQNAGSLTHQLIEGIIPIDDLSHVIAVTAGVDTQDDRLEVQYVGHDLHGGITILGYDIYPGDMEATGVYIDMGRDVVGARFQCGNKELPVINCCIDTQGHHTTMVHKFLVGNRASGIFVGINGNGAATYEMADKPSEFKGVKNSRFYSIGVNVIKQKIFNAIRRHDQEQGAYRIWSQARLPKDYAKQLVAEKMEIRRAQGLDRVVFTNEKKRRNEALDTLVYAIAAKAYIKQHRGRRARDLFPD